MNKVRLSRCPSSASSWGRCVAGRAVVVVLAGLALVPAIWAQEPPVHYLHQGTMPPGAIGSLQLQRGGPLPGFFQPVEILAPQGVAISLAEGGGFGPAQPAPIRAGMLIGQVYRFRVTNIPLHPGLEVYPTLEVVNRLYTPRGQELRFPVLVELTQDDIELALDGKFVTRVVYLEDPDMALPVAQDRMAQNWVEAAPGRDPLAIADGLGRPMAILRIGGLLPDGQRGPDLQFLFGCPPLVKFPPRRAEPAAPTQATAPAAVENGNNET